MYTFKLLKYKASLNVKFKCVCNASYVFFSYITMYLQQIFVAMSYKIIVCTYVVIVIA